ncbi:MAG: DUF3570 domain-containing protein [Proteobacteria bacterium]|nr:DUF3570 domain-containing protein [Pseudomonadota bacterium]
MQLKKPESILRALAAATCGLFAAAPVAQAQVQTLPRPAQPGQWEVESAILFYSEQDRVTAIEPVVRMKKQLSEDEDIAIKLVVDSLTGSSPSGAVPSTTPQTFTSPSGNQTYNTPANTIPLDPTFLDTRVALTFDWTRPLGAERRIVYTGHASKEYDYTSIGAGATVSQDFNNRNTTLTAGLSYDADQVEPVGGVPLGFATQPAFPGVKTTAGTSENKTVFDVLLGVTQVVNRTTLMQFNYTHGPDSGYLTDPYKLVSVVDAVSGIPLQTIYEKRPEDRARNALYWRTLKAFDRDVLNVSYRYYWDDWGVKGHTVDLRYRRDLGGSYLEPHLRFSQQASAADFYRPFLRAGESTQFASADYRLAKMSTVTAGVKYAIPAKTGEFSARLEYMLQTGEDHPAGAPGQLAGQDLFPDTKAVIVQFSYSFGW